MNYLKINEFLKYKIKNRSILIIEPNPYHGEILPGISQYFLELGYSVDVFIRDEVAIENPFCLYPKKEKINIFYGSSEDIKKTLTEDKIKKYYLVCISSSAFWDTKTYFGSYIDYLGFIPSGQIGSIFIEHNLDSLKEDKCNYLFEFNRIFSIFPRIYDNKPTTFINPHYFGEEISSNKDDKLTKFIIIGSTNPSVKNTDLLIKTVGELLDQKIDNFLIYIIGSGDLQIPERLKNNVIYLGRKNFSELYRYISNSDYIIPLLDPSIKEHEKYIDKTTTGSLQLSIGFKKPLVINDIFAKAYGLDKKSSIIYTKDNLKLAMKNAILLKVSKNNVYKNITNNIEKIKNELHNQSLENIKKCFEILEKDPKIRDFVDTVTINQISHESTKILLNQKDNTIGQLQNSLDTINSGKLWKTFQIYFKFRDKILKNLKNPTLLLKKIIKKTVPIGIRKKIKYTIESKILRRNSAFKIPSNILQEWQNFEYKENHFDLFNFSVIAWDFRHQRPQQLAKYIGDKGNRVFYIKNEFIPQNNLQNKDFAPIKVEKKEKNVYEITLSATRNIFIYNDKPTNRDKEIMFSSFKTILKMAKVINPIGKIDHPFWKNIIDDFKIPYIYDCMDNHQGFSDNSKDNINLEKLLFKDSNYTVVTSNYLNEIAIKNNVKNIKIIKNAGEFEHFNISQKKLSIPDDISSIKTKIIGYYGAIADWFDIDILEELAVNHKDKTIVLIGNVTNNKVEKLSQKYKNIVLLGEKPYSILPNYLKKFDVCIIPFVLNELIKATHPVKIFEYLAAGKPIVSIELPEISDLNKVVIFSNKKDFFKKINIALKTEEKSVIESRINVAKKNTWEIRANTLINICNEILFPKVSIVLLSYNNHQMLDEAIKSILNRTFYPNYELIIVDNNSNKETIEIIKKYRSDKRIVTILNKENLGFAKGNNIGTEKAIGDYIILLNNDILVTPGWISRLVYHISNPKNGLVGPVTNSIGNEAKIEIEYDPKNTNDLETTVRNYTSKNWGKIIDLEKIAAFCWMISRKNYKKIGKLDEIFGKGMFEDDDYCYRVRKENLKIICAEDVFIHHYGGASFKQIQSAEYQKLFEDNKKIFEKKWKTKWIPHVHRNK